MKNNVFYTHKYGKKMNSSLLSSISALVSILVSIITVSIWGGTVNSRLKTLENETREMEDRQTRIESKLDSIQYQQNQLIHDCKDSIIKVILDQKK